MIGSKTLLAVLGISAGACAHVGGPTEDAMRAYARALEEGRLDDAWALSAAIDREHFVERYADPARRHRRAEEVSKAAEGQADGVQLEARSGGWRVIEVPVAAAPRDDAQQAEALIAHFLASVASGDFEAVFSDLGASWRSRYTPDRLKADFASEPAAAARLARIRAALPGKWELTAVGPELPLGDGKRLKLQREGDALKVVALE